MTYDKKPIKAKGTCTYCKKSFSKAGMGKHLLTCKQRLAHTEEQPQKTTLPYYLIRAEGGLCWKYIEIPATDTLDDLDKLLRNTWLECCGHLSCFRINQMRYESSFCEEDILFLGGRASNMDVKLSKALKVGDSFFHEYDYGSTTVLRLKVIAEWLLSPGKPINICARNDMPHFKCEGCESSSSSICSLCGATLCGKCVNKHECIEEEGDDYMIMPLVNSPRTGVCGYVG